MKIPTKLIAFTLLTVISNTLLGYELKDLLPKESVIVSVNNLKTFKKAASKSCIGKAFHNKEVKKSFQNKTVFDLLRAKKDNELKEVTRLNNADFDSLTGSFYIAISFNVFSSKKERELNHTKEEIFVITEQTEEEFAKSRESDKKINELEKKTVTTTTYDFQGVTVYVDREKEDGIVHLDYSAVVNNQFSVASRNNKEWLEKTIMKLQEEAPEMDKTEPPELELYISAQALLALLRKNATKNSNGEKWDTVLSALGLNNLERISLTIAPRDDAFYIKGKVIGLSPDKGIMTLIDTTPVPLDYRLSYVPKNTFNYSITRFNLQKFFDNISPIITAVKPDMLKQIKASLISLEAMLELNLYDSLIAPMGASLYINYVSIRNDELENASIFTLNEPNILEESLAQISKKFPMLKREIFLDHPVYSFTKGENTPNKQTFGITIANDLLFVGLEKSIHNILRTINAQKETSSQFYDSLLFACQKDIPENTFSYTLYDLNALIKTLSKKQESPSSIMLNKLLKKNNSNVKLDKIANYFTHAITSMTFEDGTLDMTLKIYNKQ